MQLATVHMLVAKAGWILPVSRYYYRLLRGRGRAAEICDIYDPL